MTNTQDDAQNLAEELKDKPNEPDKWHKLGVVYLSMKQWNNAEISFKQCLKLDKQHSLALGELGSLYILKGKTKAAIKNLEKSLKIDPGQYEFWSSLGIAYLKQSRAKDAIEAIEHSLAINPNYRDALVALAVAYNNLESWEEALEILRQADMKFPNDFEIHKGKARSLMKLGRTQELEETYLAMRKIDPEDHTLLMYLGQMAFRRGEKVKGLEYYRKAVEMDPESFMAWKILAEALQKLGMKDEAREAMEKYKEIEFKLRKSGTRIIQKI